jgi:hypothetical protein
LSSLHKGTNELWQGSKQLVEDYARIFGIEQGIMILIFDEGCGSSIPAKNQNVKLGECHSVHCELEVWEPTSPPRLGQ